MKNDKYVKLYQTILKEHESVFEKQSLDEMAAFMEQIKKAERIFVMGVGREGIAGRAFAMRLMHLGKEAHWIWDDTTPGIQKGDLFIAISGSGKIGHIHYTAGQAKKAGASLAVVTGSPREKTALSADCVLFVPASVFNGTDRRIVPSIQPMGNLFEQHLFLLFDIIIMMMEEEWNVTDEQMEGRHRNIE